MALLTWSGCRNVRDLAGLPTADGGTIRAGRLVRSDSLARLDAEGRAAVAAYGVSRVVDLRGVDEVAVDPGPYAVDARYRNVPWVDVDRDPDVPADRSLAEIYRAQLDRNAGAVATAVRSVAEAPPGAVVVHCAAGKDRTGMLVALLLETAGVPRDEVLADYALSADRLGVAEALEALPVAQREHLGRLAWSHRETLGSALEHLDGTYGGSRGYLRQAGGLGDDELAAVRRRLVG